MKLDDAVAKLLDVDASKASLAPAGGGCSSAATYIVKLPAQESDEQKRYFLKTGRGESARVMFAGEHASLSAIRAVVPSLCPRSYGHGVFTDTTSTYFLVTEYLNLSSSSRKSSATLAHKLAKLHTTPAPIPDGFSIPMFGFPVPTCCGDTVQTNHFTETWPDFFANHRLRFIAAQCKQRNGQDTELHGLVETVASDVIPALLGAGHLGGAKGINPVVTHGDLWSGNHGEAYMAASNTTEEVIYDSSAVYAHSEYELGIMKMFGGFGPDFLAEYHELCPKTEPVSEYNDRVRLYEL